MPANKANYIIVYENSNQIYAAASKDVALATPPPTGSTIKDKKVYFVMHEPDNKAITWYRLDDEIVQTAEVKEVKKSKSKKEPKASDEENPN